MFKDARLTVLTKSVQLHSAPTLPSFPFVNIPKTASAPRRPVPLEMQERPATEGNAQRNCTGLLGMHSKPNIAATAADSRTWDDRQDEKRPSTTPEGAKRPVSRQKADRPLSRASRPASRPSSTPAPAHQVGVRSREQVGIGRARYRPISCPTGKAQRLLPKAADFWPIPDVFPSSSEKQVGGWQTKKSLEILRRDLQKEHYIAQDIDRQIALTYKALYHNEHMCKQFSNNDQYVYAAERQKRHVGELEKFKESSTERLHHLKRDIDMITKRDLKQSKMPKETEDLIRSRVRLIDNRVSTPG